MKLDLLHCHICCVNIINVEFKFTFLSHIYANSS